MRSLRIGLSKVAGEVDPVDLFTKRSLTRECPIALTKLFEVEFRGGRAESAPLVRKAPGNRIMLAQGSAVTDESSQDLNNPVMHFCVHDENGLDEVYPRLQAVEAVDEDEPGDDEILISGNKEAEKIVKQAAKYRRSWVQNDREPCVPECRPDKKCASGDHGAVDQTLTTKDRMEMS